MLMTMDFGRKKKDRWVIELRWKLFKFVKCVGSVSVSTASPKQMLCRLPTYEFRFGQELKSTCHKQGIPSKTQEFIWADTFVVISSNGNLDASKISQILVIAVCTSNQPNNRKMTSMVSGSPLDIQGGLGSFKKKKITQTWEENKIRLRTQLPIPPGNLMVRPLCVKVHVWSHISKTIQSKSLLSFVKDT